MKTIKFLLTSIVLLLAGYTTAQVQVNVNIGSPPPWGPVGYTEVRYYYLPDVEAYYDIESSVFVYYSAGSWVHRAYLPSRYRDYDLYRGYKVVISDYKGSTPYIHFKQHKVRYAKGYKGAAQKTIGQKPGKGNSHNGSGNSNKKSKVQDSNKENSHESEKRSSGKGNNGGGKGKKK